MANYTNVIASNIADASGNKLAAGTINFLATDANDQPINFQVGGGGTVLSRSVSTTITNGVIASNFFVANPANTTPEGIFYRITVFDTNLQQTVVSYSLVSFAGDTFDLDNYAPTNLTVVPPTGGTVNGSLVVDGNLSVTGTLLSGAPGAGATAVLGTFSIAATTWTVTHNMGTQAVAVYCYDNGFNQIIPDNIQNNSVNQTTIKFLQPQTGYAVCFNVGNWTPSVAAPNNIIGNPTSSQSIAGDFPFTFGGSVSAKRIENVRYADQFAGADIGAQINAAYADLPSAGGTLYIPAGVYAFSTPIVFSTPNKLVYLKGAGATSTFLQFTGSSGTAITVDCYNGNGIAAVLEDFELNTVVSGSTATGISIGPTNNGSHTRVNRVFIDGFKVGALTQTYGVTFSDCQIGNGSSAASSIGLSVAGTFSDDTRIRGGVIQSFSTLVSNTGTNPVWLDHVILANATVGPWVSNSGAIHCTDVHFFNQASGPATNWFANPTGSVTYIHNSVFEDAKTTGTPTSFITVSGGILIFTNNVLTSLGETVTEAILFSGSGQGFLSGNTVNNTSFIPALYNQGFGSGVINIGFPTNLGQQSVFGPTQIRMDGTTSGSGVFDLFDTTGSNHKYFRVNGNQLQILNSAGAAVIATLDDVGNFTAPSAVKGTLGLVAGSGTTLARYARYTPTLSPSSVAANTTAEQTFTSVLTSGDFVLGVSKPTAQAGLGIVGWRASGTSLLITFSNNTASPIVPTASETYQVLALQ